MELLEGESLREVISSGGLTAAKAVEYARAIADGLAAAHEKGIIHRDLKPENVFLTRDGRIKILDFGLAKGVSPDVAAGTESSAPTASMATAAGVVMGTVGYMSPEQVRGEKVDHRTDIFALGSVLFELLAGRRAFPGATAADVISAVLTRGPPTIADSVAHVSSELSAIVERCMEKRPELRFQSARDLAFSLGTLAAGAVDPRKLRKGSDDERPSVAVLPFANLSADPEQEYFCDGMAEEILNALAQVRGLRVVARTSAFAFKGETRDIREIGSALDVAAIVEGSVRKAGDRLRITAQLIDTRDGSHLWSERFDRTLEDVFAIQDEIALAIVEILQVELLGREREAVVRRPTESLDAYQNVLKGWFHWNQLTEHGYTRSLECFQEAIRIDPSFANAYVGLATATLSQCWWGELAPEDGLAAARPLVSRALELDDTIPEVHSFRAMIHVFERKWEAAEEAHLRAIELGPNIAEVHGQWAAQLLIAHRFDECLAEIRLTQKLDPLSPNWNAWTSSWTMLAGNHDEGLQGLKTVAAMHPQHWMPHNLLSFHYGLEGRIEEARDEAEKSVELSGQHSSAVTQLACVCYLQGETGRGAEMFDLLRKRARATYVPPTFFAWIHLARGETDEAVGELERGFRGLDPWLTFHRHMAPANAADDPRIDAVIERIGL
jgi:TolB-like protein/tetratricopeptide (TPR) repeat protein